jgi:transposase InsO family protein
MVRTSSGKPTDEGFLYMTVVLDFFSRKITSLFLKAYKSHGKLDSMTYHSDRGCQYTSHRYVNLLLSLNVSSG